MRVFEALADELVRAGVDRIFTLMSQETLKLTVELERRGVSIYHVRHEHIAMGMADGYSRSSGKLAVALLGEGPGITNSMNAFITALRADSQVLVIAVDDLWMPGAGPDVPMNGSLNKAIDQPALLDALGARHADIRSAETAASDLRTCLELIQTDRHFLVVGIAFRLLERRAGDRASELQLAPRVPVPPDPDGIAMVVDLLEADWTSRRPVIIAGRGARRSDARHDLMELGDRIGALMGTTMQAKGLFHGSPWDIAVVGSYSTPITTELLQSADLVLVFGAAMTTHTTYGGTLFPKAKVVHIDADPEHIGRYRQVDLGIVGDAREAARALNAELARRGHTSAGYRRDELALRIAREMRPPYRDQSNERGLDPRTVARTLDRVLPEERTFVLDAGNHVAFPIRHLNVTDPTKLIWVIEYSAISVALGVAMGSAVARPDRLTVLWIGDGGMMMNLGDLNTAARYGLRVLMVVANDAAFGAERHYLRHEGYDGEIAAYPTPSFEAIAREMGLPAVTVTSIARLEEIGARAQTLTGPMLLDCKIDPEQTDTHRIPDKEPAERETEQRA